MKRIYSTVNRANYLTIPNNWLSMEQHCLKNIKKYKSFDIFKNMNYLINDLKMHISQLFSNCLTMCTTFSYYK